MEHPPAEILASGSRATQGVRNRSTALRPSPPEYQEGCVPLVADGYGNLLNLFPGTTPTDNYAVADVLTIARAGKTLLVMTIGKVINAGSYDPFAHGP